MKQLFSGILIVLLFFSCTKEKKLFELVDSDYSGIHFSNQITETDTLNILDNDYVYNGAGVAVGDLNNDGLEDLYFSGNQVQDKLYLNRGNLKFEDISLKANIKKDPHFWSTGVTMVDINLDGFLDIYVCHSMSSETKYLRDFLYINLGPDKNGIPEFSERGTEYGLLAEKHTSSGNFFDFDNDGDLDLFLNVNIISEQYPNQFVSLKTDGSDENKDILYENTWDGQKKHPYFKNITDQSGIKLGGYSHSCITTDFNNDGFKDIYIANDYLSNDILYINQKNGHFEDRLRDVFKHSSYYAMGTDLGDINNDGLNDLINSEMLPYDNKRKRLNLPHNNYTNYLFFEKYKYQYQYIKNSLHLNQGINPLTGLPIFADISYLAGIEATDWSWTPLIADFDNDGNKDIFIANGFPRDVMDHDFVMFRKDINSALLDKNEIHKKLKAVKIPNFIFKNNGNLRFERKIIEWGFEKATFSNGAAYADLDNDGDIELICNNINDNAFIYKNTLYEDRGNSENGFFRIKLIGDQYNPNAYGSQVKIWHQGRIQMVESMSGRGYMSKSENVFHFGVKKNTTIDSAKIYWSNGYVQKINNPKINQSRIIKIGFSQNAALENSNKKSENKYFEHVENNLLNLDFVHSENDFIDYNFQQTLPHKYSQYGPALAVGDLNGDKLDDFIMGSSSWFQGVDIFFQNSQGKFSRKNLKLKKSPLLKEEDLGIKIFDADNDGDNDFYVVRGSGQHPPGSELYQDILCINNGKGEFKIDMMAIPKESISGQVVKSADFDKDGDMDLMVTGRIKPMNYPLPAKTTLLRNDSKNGKVRFVDVTNLLCPELNNIGLISDAIFSDFNNDNKIDIILAGEWMPITFLKNTGNNFKNITRKTGLNNFQGWWTSLTAGDFDNDGDMDYIAGNFGINNNFRCSAKKPLRLIAKDFDKNGKIDPFISVYIPNEKFVDRPYFNHSKDDITSQLPKFKEKFVEYGKFGETTADNIFTKNELKGSILKSANYMYTSFIENLGNSKFKINALPIEAQISPVYGVFNIDINKDGLLDCVLVGNDFGIEIGQGRNDASNGLVLLNTNKKRFYPLSFEKSGFFVPGDSKALVSIVIKNKPFLIAGQNRGKLIIHQLKGDFKVYNFQTNAFLNNLKFKNGKSRKIENQGSFLSQNSNTFIY